MNPHSSKIHVRSSFQHYPTLNNSRTNNSHMSQTQMHLRENSCSSDSRGASDYENNQVGASGTVDSDDQYLNGIRHNSREIDYEPYLNIAKQVNMMQ